MDKGLFLDTQANNDTKRFEVKKEEKNEYYPNNLSLVPPVGENVFEFLIVTKDEIGVMANITSIFANHRVNLQNITSNRNPETKTCVAILFADFTKADSTVEGVLKEIKTLHSVSRIEAQNTRGRVFDSFLFPLLIRNKIRVITLRMEGLLKAERHLVQSMGSAGASIMFQVGRSYGADVMGALQSDLASLNKVDLLANFEAGLRATGWGICSIRSGRNHDYQINVEDPPIMLQDEKRENGMFFIGLILGALEKLDGVELRVSGSTRDLSKNTMSVRMERRNTNIVNQDPTLDILP